MSAASIYPRLFTKLFCSPLMLHGPVRSTFEQALIQRMFGSAVAGGIDPGTPGSLSLDTSDPSPDRKPSTLGQPHSGSYASDFEHAADYCKQRDEFIARRRIEKIYRKIGKVAVVSIDGVIDKRISQFDMDCYGGCDLADVDAALTDAASDRAIKKTVLYMNTPGGSVTGTPETAARVAALRELKEVHAFIDVQCCSAGYYIGSQAHHIAAAPSACIGSIGVYMAILDATRAIEMDGYKVQMIKSGKYKAMGAPWNPLSKEETAMLQRQCDVIFEAFQEACTALRPRISEETMQGQWFDATEAEDRWLVDELTGDTLDEYISRLLLS